MSDAVLFDVPEPGIAVLTINRPEVRNSLGRDVREGLFAGWERFERDPDLRVAILTAAGDKAFCAGGNLKEMSEMKLVVPPRDMFPVPGDNIELTKPTIAAVNGVAYACGCGTSCKRTATRATACGCASTRCRRRLPSRIWRASWRVHRAA